LAVAGKRETIHRRLYPPHLSSRRSRVLRPIKGSPLHDYPALVPVVSARVWGEMTMAASGEKGEASGSEQPRSEPSLEELLKSLNLKGEDIGGVFVPKEEVDSLKEGTKWKAVMRVLTTRPFSAISMKKTMHFAWAPA
jgi:hypothetical protein